MQDKGDPPSSSPPSTPTGGEKNQTHTHTHTHNRTCNRKINITKIKSAPLDQEDADGGDHPMESQEEKSGEKMGEKSDHPETPPVTPKNAPISTIDPPSADGGKKPYRSRIPYILFPDLFGTGPEDKGKGGNGGNGGNGGEGGGNDGKGTGAGAGGGRRGGGKNKRPPPPEDPTEDDGVPPLIITLLGMKRGPGSGGGGPPGGSAGNDRKKRKEEGGPEDFYAYFREAKTLTPIEKEIKTLDDLIALGKTYDPMDKKRYVIQMRALHKCVPVLEELNGMIGMKNVKSMIMDLLFFRLQNIEDGIEEEEAAAKGTKAEAEEKAKEECENPEKKGMGPFPIGSFGEKIDERDPLIDFFNYDPFVHAGMGPPPPLRRGNHHNSDGGCCSGDRGKGDEPETEEDDGDEAKLQVHTMESLGKEKGVLRDMYHMVITGSPGCGKTEVAKILAKLYYCLGIARKDKFTLARRSDLIGKYLGHTAKMTQDVFHRAKGGILFIDEAYALGNPEGKDSFSKECIDTINQNLTENKDTIVFIAGYKEQLEESFFAYNPGLHRRFKFRLEVDKYNAEELRLIYLKKIRDAKWGLFGDDPAKSIPVKLFERHREIFKFNGGDMENLWHLTKIVHARRVFGKDRALVRKISEEDVKRAIELYMENDEVKKRNDDIRKYIQETVYI